MSRYELTINKDYVADWRYIEGLRELFQNAVDQGNYSYDFDEENKTLKIINYDAGLNKNTLLLGTTSKSDDKYIGQFGEGYKLAVLVLLRSGFGVTIYNGYYNEIWKTSIIKSRRYNAEIPVFDISRSKIANNNLIIEVSGISKEQFEEYVKYNLNLRIVDKYITPYGDIIKSKDEIGNLYVGGLYVCHDENLKFGYNFNSDTVSLNRDRNIILGFASMTWQTSKMWSYVFNLDSNLIDLSLLDSYDFSFISAFDNSSNLIKKKFEATYGENTIPVNNSEDYDRLKSLGYSPMYVSISLYDCLYDYYSSIIDNEEEENLNENIIENLDNLFKNIKSVFDKCNYHDNDLINNMNDVFEQVKNYIKP